MQNTVQAGDGSLAAGSVPDGFDPVGYINDPDWHTSSLGLHRIAELMERLGNPQDQLRFVHVAGTNGKGSTCSFTASVLVEAGYRTGMFTSPYVVEFSERIQVDGSNISPDELLDVTLKVREQAEAMSEHPTEFELMTAVALLHFAQQQCDFVVLEVGLGGRLDSTNIIKSPEVCAICPIALDHTDILGSTLSEIAAEKAGIIKPGATVVAGVQPAEAFEVIQEHAAKAGCQLRRVDEAAIQGTPRNFSYCSPGGGAGQAAQGVARAVSCASLQLLGSYQVQNAALACEIVWALRDRGFAIDDDALVRGLESARWPARFELARRNPNFIVDGGHNAQGAQALADSLKLNFPGERPVFLMGVLADKDYPSMIATVAPLARAFVCIQPPVPRRLTAGELVQAIRSHLDEVGIAGVQVLEASSIADGVQTSIDLAGDGGLVCAFGSLYSVADIYQALARV